jgi:predicted ATPase
MDEPLIFEVYYRERRDALPITYEIAVALDKHRRPYVKTERLGQRRKGQSTGWPFSFLIIEDGRGVAWKGENEGIREKERHLSTQDIDKLIREESNERESVELIDNRKLGIATLGALKQHPRISKFRQFIEGWYLSYFTPDAARSLPLAGPQEHLNIHGDNMGNVVQFMERDCPEQFAQILRDIANKIPGIEKISTEPMSDGRLLLRFKGQGFDSPFSAQQISDGTLKVFAYLLLLSAPSPRPFICIEEPENGLYHKLLEILVKQFRNHVSDTKSKSQIFITTHQPYFVDALEPNEVWILEKGSDGFSNIRRASEDAVVQGLVDEGLPLGGLWYSDYLEKK